MAFDPSIIADIGASGPDIGAAIGKGMQLRDMADAHQLNQLNIQGQRRAASEDAQVNEILKTAKYGTPQELDATVAQVNKVSPRRGMELKQWGQKFQSGEIQNQLDQLTLLDARQGLIVSAIEPIIGQARTMKNNNASDLEVNAFIAKQMPGAIQALRSQVLSDGKPALPDETLKQVSSGKMDLATLESYEKLSSKGLAAIKQRLEEMKAQTGQNKEEETERHNREIEAQGRNRMDLSREKIQRDAEGGLTPDTVQFVAERYLSGDTSVMQGLSKGDRAKIQNASKDIAQIAGLTGKDAAANRAEFTGLLAGERTLAQRQANIDTATQEFKNVAPTVLQAARDLPRGAFVPWNKLEQIWERGTSDPKLARFAQGARTLANLYTRATVPGASSLADREGALHDLPTYTDEKSFEATVDFMLREIDAAQRSPRDVRRDLRETVTGRTESPAGAAVTARTSPGAAAAPAGGPQAALPAGWTVTEH